MNHTAYPEWGTLRWFETWANDGTIIATLIIGSFTLITVFYLALSFHKQNITTSANLAEKYYEKCKKEHQGIWNKIITNYENSNRSDRDTNPIKLEKYTIKEIYEILDTLERVSLLVKSRLISLEYAYEMFSTLYFPCLKDNDLQIMMVYRREPRFYTNVKQVSKWCNNYFNKNKWFMFRYHYLWWNLK